jgi:hypothetical protein
VRCFLLLAVGFFSTAGAASAAAPSLLLEALKKTGEEADRWAYTETSAEKDRNGHSDGETVVRFDPSKPYAEQFTPLKIDGKPPTAKQLKEFRKRGEKRGEELERDSTAGQSAEENESPGIAINGQGAVVDLEKAKVIHDAGGSITYEIPLRKDGRRGLPVEKFQLTIRVNQERRELESAAVRLLAPWRVMLVARINTGVLNVEFTTVDAKFPPVLTSLTGDMAVSVFFLKQGGTFEQKRTDFQHVKPFNERFGVKIGPLKALPF